jgi:hypothetical protein
VPIGARHDQLDEFLKIGGDDAGLALGRDIERALRGWQQHERTACGVAADLLKLFDAIHREPSATLGGRFNPEIKWRAQPLRGFVAHFIARKWYVGLPEVGNVRIGLIRRTAGSVAAQSPHPRAHAAPLGSALKEPAEGVGRLRKPSCD